MVESWNAMQKTNNLCEKNGFFFELIFLCSMRVCSLEQQNCGKQISWTQMTKTFGDPGTDRCWIRRNRATTTSSMEQIEWQFVII